MRQFGHHWGRDEKQPLCLIANLPVEQQPHPVYERRFWSETLFGIGAGVF
jgi:hypothetical protein